MLIKSKVKTIGTGLALSVFTLSILFVGFEFVLRVLKIQSDNFITQDPVLGWTHMPSKEGYSISKEFKVKRRINKDGFIGPDYSYEKAGGVYRVVVAGDSLTEAFQVIESDTYAALAEAKVNSLNLGKRVEILNMGIAGVGTKKELYILNNKGLKFNPDLLVLAFFAGNDFYDNLTESVNEGAEFQATRRLKNSVKLFLRNHSAAWRFVLHQKSRNRLLNFIKRGKNPAAGGGGSGNAAFQDANSEDVRALAEKSLNLILEFKKLAEQEGKDHLVLILPAAGHIYLKESGNLTPEEEAGEILKNSFISNKINFIDLLPDFKNSYKLNPDTLLYFPADGHPNENAHAIISDKLANYLSGKLIGN